MKLQTKPRGHCKAKPKQSIKEKRQNITKLKKTKEALQSGLKR